MYDVSEGRKRTGIDNNDKSDESLLWLHKMEESPYVPNNIPPALGLVFGSSNYGDAIRMQRPFATQDGKELNLSNLSASSFGLRPMESYGGLPASLVHLQNPFLHPALDPRLPFGSAGAFRPVVTTSTASVTNVGVGEVDRDRGVKSLPSAFTPPNNRRSKLTEVMGGESGDRERSSSTMNSSGGGGTGGMGSSSSSSSTSSPSSSSVIVASSQSSQVINNHQSNSHISSHPSGVLNLDNKSSYVNGQRHRSISPTNCSSTTSKEERLSEDFINEREENGTPNSDLTDRSTPDTDTHLPNKRRRRGGGGSEITCSVCRMSLHPMELESHLLSEVEQLMSLSRLRRCESMRMDEPSTSQDSPSVPNHAKKDSPAETSQDSRWEVYNRVRSNRHSRLRLKTRRRREESGGAHVTCPVCQIPLQGSNQQLSAHVETCLRKNGDILDEDEPVDIEGDDMEDYDWHAHRRGRSTTNTSPNYSVTALNMTTNSRRREEENDSLEVVVVDGDDTSTGHAQYTESDIQSTVLRTSNSSPHHDSSNILQDSKSYTSGWGADEESSGGDDGGSNSHLNQTMLVKALKGRIRELEKELKGGPGPPQEGNHCLICMDKYKKPVVSISCWHVHCEECWLRTLGAKKLCPQCNMITSAADLRRIFL